MAASSLDMKFGATESSKGLRVKCKIALPGEFCTAGKNSNLGSWKAMFPHFFQKGILYYVRYIALNSVESYPSPKTDVAVAWSPPPIFKINVQPLS